MSHGIAVACVDVGSMRSNRLGWAIIEDGVAIHGRDPTTAVTEMIGALGRGRRLAIGFECPLYVPVREDPMELTCRRRGERYVNWCGGPGGSVLATGLVQSHWILKKIAAALPKVRATTRWGEFETGQYQILVWEAFITSKDGLRPNLKRFKVRRLGGHEHDALSGAATFVQRLESGLPLVSELESEPSMSLVGWHLWSCSLNDDASLLTEPCIVIKSRKRRITPRRAS